MAGSYNLSHRLVNSWYASFLIGISLAKILLPRIEKLIPEENRLVNILCRCQKYFIFVNNNTCEILKISSVDHFQKFYT